MGDYFITCSVSLWMTTNATFRALYHIQTKRHEFLPSISNFMACTRNDVIGAARWNWEAEARSPLPFLYFSGFPKHKTASVMHTASLFTLLIPTSVPSISFPHVMKDNSTRLLAGEQRVDCHVSCLWQSKNMYVSIIIKADTVTIVTE